MAPHLRVLAGPSLDKLTLISDLVNTNKSHKIVSDIFEGEIVANVKDFVGSDGVLRHSDYFDRQDRQGVTWSIQVQGRFLVPCSADDILFGNTFDRPLHLPWGSSAALKFMQYVDPTLEHNLSSDSRPWALSPLVSTMPHFSHARVTSIVEQGDTSAPMIRVEGDQREVPTTSSHKDKVPEFPLSESISDDTSQIHLAMVEYDSSASSRSHRSSKSSASSHKDDASSISSVESFKSTESSSSYLSIGSKSNGSNGSASGKLKSIMKLKKRHRAKAVKEGLGLTTASERRSYFSDPTRRQSLYFGPRDIITTDFCYGFIEFNPSLALRLPGGVSFDLMKYWDGQPVRFVCCQRKEKQDSSPSSSNKTADNDVPWDRMFWCIQIEIVDGPVLN